MEYTKKKLKDITPYENNPRINDDAVEDVMESIRQCTYVTPIIVDEDKVILAGHTRYKALMALGFEEIQCLVCEGLTEETKKKYRYLDNKTGEKATWDLMKLEVELEDVDLEGFDFFGMAEDFTEGASKTKKAEGSTEYDTEVFSDEEFKYECQRGDSGIL
ncbi:MAG: ParB N-terminal domain-containing protein [Lachnospiraceae bacterium]|nr:ParB N-terminal domain-containing protein [Lachnospiraceae bacterium]